MFESQGSVIIIIGNVTFLDRSKTSRVNQFSRPPKCHLALCIKVAHSTFVCRIDRRLVLYCTVLVRNVSFSQYNVQKTMTLTPFLK